MNKPVTGFTPTARGLAQMRLATSKAKLPDTFAEMMASASIPAMMADDVAAGIAELQKIFEPFPAAIEKMAEILANLLPKVATAPDAGQAKQMLVDEGRDKLMQHLGELDAASGYQRPYDENADGNSLCDLAPNEWGGTSLRCADGRTASAARDQIADALLARMLPGHVPTIGREFVSMRLEDFAPKRGFGGASNAKMGNLREHWRLFLCAWGRVQQGFAQLL